MTPAIGAALSADEPGSLPTPSLQPRVGSQSGRISSATLFDGTSASVPSRSHCTSTRSAPTTVFRVPIIGFREVALAGAITRWPALSCDAGTTGASSPFLALPFPFPQSTSTSSPCSETIWPMARNSPFRPITRAFASTLPVACPSF